MNSRERIGSYPFKLGFYGSEDPSWKRFCIVTSVLTAMQTHSGSIVIQIILEAKEFGRCTKQKTAICNRGTINTMLLQ